DDLDSRDFTIKLDPGLLYRAFFNIFINAVQSMKNGGDITITIKEENKNYHIHIRDTGEGISKKNINKIFNPFFTTKDKGSGLGLPIVKKILEGHNGTIDIKSEVGKGTSVFITLPLKS
ncbi:MAG: GHKL domain-containing protein, partial [Deltaproteobacteria bacterium]|nr:GHKL domain-containing protein [Deltaproteobacteria bacterium]